MVAPYDEPAWSKEAARRVWDGAVPLQVHLHDADVTALPPPPPFLVPSSSSKPVLSVIRIHSVD
jgi:autophagy-related protein 5